MADLGFSTFNEMIGQINILDKQKVISHWKASGLDFTKLFFDPKMGSDVPIYNCEKQNHHLEDILDRKLIHLSEKALKNKSIVKFNLPIKNLNRSTGAMLSGEVVKKYGHAGLADDTITINFSGTTGQSFGAWLCKGITMCVEGEGNDYVGKDFLEEKL